MMIDARAFIICVVFVLAIFFGGVGMGLGAWLF
jgi:hypothetical protein